MLRFRTACLALLLAPLAAAAPAKELKPKFGNIDGVYYSDVSGEREACRQAIKNKMALCRQNTNFESNTKNREHAGCLPIFRQQAESCAVHFRHQMSKCELSGPARITDFTGFGCTVTKTVVEEGGEAADRWMQARTRANLRSGPGTDHARVGLLEAGEEVLVTGEAGEWLRIRGTDGSTAFVHGSLLVSSAQEAGNAAASPSPKCAGMGEDAECWQETANKPGCYAFVARYDPSATVTWSGACAGGVAVGRGTLGWEFPGGWFQETGMLVRGERHGRWVFRWGDSGFVEEGPYVDGKRHGRWVFRWADGNVEEGPYVNDERHGRWVERYASGGRLEYDWRNGSREGQPGVFVTESGERHSGRWSGNCFRDGDGYARVWVGSKDNCPNN